LDNIDTYIPFEKIANYLQSDKSNKGFCFICRNSNFFIKYVYLDDSKEPMKATPEEDGTVLCGVVCTNCNAVKREWILVIDLKVDSFEMNDVTDKFIEKKNKEVLSG
ncbi:MAG TPA: hypothetical protein VIH61_03290, partial [Waddliaceae bacterium]